MKDLRNAVVRLKAETPLIGEKEIRIEDTCEKVFNKQDWVWDYYCNPSVFQFVVTHKLRTGSQCYYGKVGGLGYIVTEDEFES